MKRAALFVGIDRYESPEINSLKCAEKDAADLHAFFQYAAGYDDVRRLLSPDTDQVVRETRDVLRSLEAGDQFLFYFAGHGTEHNGKHLLLDAKADGEMIRFNYHVLPVEMLKALTARPGLNRVFMLDCCRNDLFKGRGKGEGLKDADGWRTIAAEEESLDGGSLTILCSCDEGQQAAELETQGLFTASVLCCLQEAREAGRGVVLNDAFRLDLSRRMTQEARAKGLGGTQRPWIQSSGGIVCLLDGAVDRAGVHGAEPSPGGVPVPPVVVPPFSNVRKKEVCALCGMRNDPDDTFKCLACGRDYLCVDHLVREERCCEECAAERVREREAEAEKKRKAREAEAERKRRENPEELELDCGRGVKLKLKRIEAGSFMMGGNSSDEKPIHRVTFKEPFYMGVYPVTQAQYEAVMGENPSRFSDEPDSPQRPVEKVSWEDAKKFCQKLSQKSGKPVGLPSEAQWEYCCRAGSTTDYCFGDDMGQLELYANYGSTPIYGRKSTSPVGSFRPNAWGLYDLHGNVWEWCEDKWHGDYKGAPTDGSAWLSGGVSDRVGRSGGWSDSAGYCRAAYRDRFGPDDRGNYLGFRLVLSPAVH